MRGAERAVVCLDAPAADATIRDGGDLMRTRVLPAMLALALSPSLSMGGGAAFARVDGAAEAKAAFAATLRSAQDGDATRYVDLAKLYLDGEGVDRDVTQALAWLRETAEAHGWRTDRQSVV